MGDAAGRRSRSSTSCCCRRRRRRRSSSNAFRSRRRRCCTEPPGPRLPSGTALSSSTSPAASSRAICRTPTRLQLQNRKRRKLGPSRGAAQGLRNPSLLPPEEDSCSEHLREGRPEGGGLSLAHSGEKGERLLHPRPAPRLPHQVKESGSGPGASLEHRREQRASQLAERGSRLGRARPKVASAESSGIAGGPQRGSRAISPHFHLPLVHAVEDTLDSPA